MTDFLDTIAKKTRARIAASQKQTTIADLKNRPLFERMPHNVEKAFTSPDINIISEIKFASPSEGSIHPTCDPASIAKEYLEGGARMISVLTEPDYFKGDLRHLQAVREVFPEALLLRKDFILDPYQLFETRASGADCVLFIMALNAPKTTQELLNTAISLGLTALVEVHDAAEMEDALALGATFIGVNNRNLKTLEINFETSRQLITYKTDKTVFICESGLKTTCDIKEMKNLGYDGFLIGSYFMRQASPGTALGALRTELSQRSLC